MSKQPKIIAITGAESTGKSTLAEALTSYYNVPFVPEYARDYVLSLNRNYTYNDIVHIAEKQVEELNTALNHGSNIVILDTWLIITKIWFQELFKRYPIWLDDKIRSTKIDLFLVCDTDLPWVDDPVRENGGISRIQLQKKYINEIRAYGFPYKIIGGNREARIKKAVNYIANLK